MNGTTLTREKTPQDHVGIWIARITLTLLGSLIIVFTWTWIYPFDPITKLRISVVNQPVVGASIVAEIDYCKTRAWVPAEARWSLNNEITIVLPVQTASLPTGCQVKRIYLPIPIHVAPGAYQLQEELVYSPWPWRDFVYVVRSPMFTLRPEIAVSDRR
jgi:hypothetical protein